MAELPLAGRLALVTGAAKRIGRGIALRLAADGADVVVNYRSSPTEAKELVRTIEGPGRRAMAIQADVSQRGQVQQMFAEVDRVFGRLDILVNNAGTFFAAPFEELTEEQWDTMLATNLKAHFLCAQAAVPLMRRHGSGSIINISSLGGLRAWPKYTHYCVSKAGVIMLTRCLARALAPQIRVNSVAPGAISLSGEPPDESFISRVPLGRMGKPEDIADAVAFLAQAEYITGQVIVVDGGRSLS